MMRSVFVAAGFAAAAWTLSLPASAQDQPPDKWVMYCSSEGGKDCGAQATIDGNSLLGQFLVMRYSAAYNKISVVGDGQGVRASIQVDSNPFISTSICGQGICQFDEAKSAELLQQLRTGSQIQVQLQLQGTMAGPFTQSLKGFDRELQRAIQAQRAR